MVVGGTNHMADAHLLSQWRHSQPLIWIGTQWMATPARPAVVVAAIVLAAVNIVFEPQVLNTIQHGPDFKIRKSCLAVWIFNEEQKKNRYNM